jgi:cation transport protein ChaC
MSVPVVEGSYAAHLGLTPGSDLWVFGYGSLIWNPGFAAAERRCGRLFGWHRAFCVYSHRHRGTPQQPGAVLGLDRGGSCRGVLYRVRRGDVEPVLAYLWQREMVTGVYQPRLVPVRSGSETLRAVAFLADAGHRQYCGHLGLDAIAGLIRQGVGASGDCLTYLAETVAHLRDLGMVDRALEALLARARQPL